MASGSRRLRFDIVFWARPRIARWLTVVWAVSYFFVESAAAAGPYTLLHLVAGVPLFFIWWLQLTILGWRTKPDDFPKPRGFWVAWTSLPLLCVLLVCAGWALHGLRVSS